MPKPLDLPDVRQRTGHDCATAALRTVYQWHFGRDSRIRDLSSAVNGTDPATLEANIRVGGGWNANGGEMILDDLAHYCATWRPVIALISPDYPDSGESHYVVVAGVYRGRVHYQCPEQGPGVMAAAKWLSLWHGRGKHADFRCWCVAAWPRI